jgi:hypothetical protein
VPAAPQPRATAVSELTFTMPNDSIQIGHARASGLVDVLDRVLDKGLVIAGDIKISIAEVELLTIRIRLMVCSIDKAEQIGLDWWKHDRHLSIGSDELAAENEKLRDQIRRLERQLEAVPGTAQRAPRLRAKRLDRR